MKKITMLIIIIAVVLSCSNNKSVSENQTGMVLDNVKFTNGVPICPYCKKPTMRTKGMTSSTLMYYQPVYNEQGKNTNPDRNTITTEYYCNECGNSYSISGNWYDGWKYILEE